MTVNKFIKPKVASALPERFRKAFLLSLSLFLVSPLYAGEIALSFDDAPMPDTKATTGLVRTQQIISGLKKAGVEQAIFFSTTVHIDDKGHKRLLAYQSAGHLLANHTHTHASANKTPYQDFMLDVYKAHLILSEYEGSTNLFRFPYLHRGKDSASAKKLHAGLQDLGYRDGYVTIDNFDWYMNSLYLKAREAGKAVDYEALKKLYIGVLWEAIMFYDAIAKDVLGRSPKHVLLLHENDLAALFIDDLVAHIKSKGWSITTPTEAYKDPIAEVQIPGGYFKQGKVAAIAAAADVDRSKLRHPAENTEYLDALFEREGVFR